MFELVSSATVFQGRIFDVRQDFLRLADSRVIQMDTVIHNDAVTVLPVDSEGNIWFIRQYRHAIGREILELPAGVAETGEDPLDSAQRELREEIGMAAGQLVKIGGFFLAPGYSTEFMHVYLGTELTPAPLPGDETEIIRVETISAGQAVRLAEQGGLQDSKSLIALLWARSTLERMGAL